MKDQMLKHYNISLNYVMLDKTRKAANVIDEMVIIGDVTGKDVIILDDMIDTAGTLCKAAEVLKDAGAKSVRAIISHGVLSGQALERIGVSKLTELIISDSLPRKQYNGLYSNNVAEENSLKGSKKIQVISVGGQIAFAIAAINNNLSYEILKGRQNG